MVKKIIREWTDGDSGIFTDGKKFRLSNVSAPEKHEPGYNLATLRSERLVHPGTLIDIKTTGKDTYNRQLVEITAHGRQVNKILEMKNKLFYIKPDE